jgi:hypothetical protein
MEQPLLGDNYVFSLSLSLWNFLIWVPCFWDFTQWFALRRTHGHESSPSKPGNPLLLQIKNNSEWTIREWFMALIDSYRKQWVIVHLLNCNFHQQVPSTYLFITCLPTHSQTLREPNWIFGHYYWCAKSTWEEVQANPTKHYTTAANPQIVITFLLSAPRVQA